MHEITHHSPIRNIPPRIAHIILAVAEETGVPVADILGPRRLRKMAWARAEAMRRVRALDSPSPTLPQIGKWFGRDHSSVILAIRGCEQREAA